MAIDLVAGYGDGEHDGAVRPGIMCVVEQSF